MPQDNTASLVDSLAKLSERSAAADSGRYAGRSEVAVWLDKILSSDARLIFIESLVLVLAGATFAYLLYRRSKRSEANDASQARALSLAAFAIGALATKGLFFIASTAAFAGLIPPWAANHLLRLGWQFSLLWFVYFGFIFCLNFIRSRKSYDAYYLVAFTLLFALITLVYTQGKWEVTFAFDLIDNPGTVFVSNAVTFYAVVIHLLLWTYLFLYIAYRIYKKAMSYRDLSARRAMLVLSMAMLGVAAIGILSFFLFRRSPGLFITQSYTAACAMMMLFYFSVRNAYKHGRYKRV
ncbi:MAG: hypothetical protein IAF08_03620 [Rhizobacter sp.]|nr:hypothetical protein [Chlorobiales bacterium]